MVLDSHNPLSMKIKHTTLPLAYLLILSVFSCTSISKVRSGKQQYKDIYVNQFKLVYIKQLLKKSYNHSFEINAIINADHSGFTESILHDGDFEFIDSLTNLDNTYMIADSIEGRNRAEGAQGKRPLQFFIDILSAKKLDQLAKRRMKLNPVPEAWKL